MKNRVIGLVAAVILAVTFAGCGIDGQFIQETAQEFGIDGEALRTMDADELDAVLAGSEENTKESLEIPAYGTSPYAVINENIPFFSEEEITGTVFETYSDLDELGRCRTAFANICKELMPTEEREPIGQIRPSGWQTVKYNGYVDGNYLYNRCHLIGYQLAGENANEKNLITGTRYMNVEGMLPFENEVAGYLDQNPGNHVLYRVTPVFTGENLVADGVLMEAYSVEDNGTGISFCVFCYNVQPGIIIDYSNGDSCLDENFTGEYASGSSFDDGGSGDTGSDYQAEGQGEEKAVSSGTTYVVNTNTGKFHYPDCGSVTDMASRNMKEVEVSRDELVENGYIPCGRCNP